MKLFFFIVFVALSGCSVLSKPIVLSDPATAQIAVSVQYPDHVIKTFHLTNFSPLSRLLAMIDCQSCDLTRLNPQTILKNGDTIVLHEKAGFSVSLNQATLAELMTLPGIGESLAQRILDYRTVHGFFQKTEDIMRIKGIKQGLFDKIKAYLCL